MAVFFSFLVFLGICFNGNIQRDQECQQIIVEFAQILRKFPEVGDHYLVLILKGSTILISLDSD